jgi:hypothetical protein
LPGLAGVRAVADQLHDPVREPLKDHVDQHPRKFGLGRPLRVKLRACVVLGAKQTKQDRQADLSTTQAVKLHNQHDNDPAVAPASPPARALGLRAVVEVVRAEDLPSRAPEQRVIDRQADRPILLDEQSQQKVRKPQPELIGLPARPREEVVRTAVMPAAGEPRGLQHPRHRAIPDAADEPDHEHAERVKRRLREARREQGQQPGERTGHGGDSWCRAAGTSEASRGQIGLSAPDSGSPHPLLAVLGRERSPCRGAGCCAWRSG